MKRYGIIGWPIKHSLSPDMHNAAFKKLGIDAVYEKFPVEPENLEDFLLNRKDILGFNVTIPHKIRAKEILDKKSATDPSASHDVSFSGAVNTVKRVGDKIEYLNTDVSGFRASLENDLGFKISEYQESNIFVLGCGGAARAVITSLLQYSTVKKIYVNDINEKAMDLTKKHFSNQQKLKFIKINEIENIIKGSQLLINTTPVGMKQGDGSPVDKRLLRKELYVYDVIYNIETQLVKDARLIGAEAITGEGMLAWQGALAFDHWIDECEAPAAVIGIMKEALASALNKK